MRRSAELERLVEDWFAAATRGDDSAVDRHVSPDPGTRLIGSDPGEWIDGGEAVAEFLRGEVRGAAGTVSFTPNDVEAYEEGTVGWATARLTLTLSDGAQVSPRWTSVFHREGEVWKFVLTHASIGVANDAAGWTYPG